MNILDSEEMDIVEESLNTLETYIEALREENEVKALLRDMESLIECAEELRDTLVEELAYLAVEDEEVLYNGR